jgi:hypothetical protein
VHRPRVGPAGDDARVVLRRRPDLARVGRRRRRGLAAAAEGQPRALVLDAELDAAVQGARPEQRARGRRSREDDPLLLLVIGAVQHVREAAVVVPRAPRAALAPLARAAARAWHEGRRRVQHGGRAQGGGRLGLGLRRGAPGEGDDAGAGAGGQGGRVQQPRGGEQGTRTRAPAAAGAGTVIVARNGRRARGLIGDVAPLRAGAVHRPRSPPQDHLLDLRSQEHGGSTGPRIQDQLTIRSARKEKRWHKTGVSSRCSFGVIGSQRKKWSLTNPQIDLGSTFQLGGGVATSGSYQETASLEGCDAMDEAESLSAEREGPIKASEVHSNATAIPGEKQNGAGPR